MISINKKIYSIVLTFTLAFTHGILAHDGHDNIDNQHVEVAQEAGESKKVGLSSPFDFDPAGLQKLVLKLREQLMGAVLRRQQKMYELLPEECKELTMPVEQEYESLVSRVNLINQLIVIIESIRSGIAVMEQAGTNLNTNAQEVSRLLERFHGSLIDESFAQLLKQTMDIQVASMPLIPGVGGVEGLLQMLPQDLFDTRGGMVQPIELSDLEILRKIVPEFFADYQVDIAQYADQRTITFFSTLLTDMCEKNAEQLIVHFFDYINPECESVKTKLDDIAAKLELMIKSHAGQVAQKQDVAPNAEPKLNETQEAIAFWQKRIKRFAKTISVLLDMQEGAHGMLLSKNYRTIFKYFAYAYDVADEFYTLHKKDYKYSGQVVNGLSIHRDVTDKHILVPFICDNALRGGLAMWYYLSATTQTKQGMVFENMLKQNSLQDMNAKSLLISDVMSIPVAACLFAKPTFMYKKKHELVHELQKVLTAGAYYHIFKRGLFSGNNSTQDFLQNIWPNTDRHVKDTVVSATYTINKYLTRSLHTKIYQSVNPQVIEKIKRWTWEIIKPEMIGAFTEMLIPMLFLKGGDPINAIANCHDFDVYGSGNWFNRIRAGHLSLFNSPTSIDPTRYFSALHTTDLTLQNRGEAILAQLGTEQRAVFRRAGIDVDAYWIESRAISYVVSSVGFYWGRKLTHKFRTQIGNVVWSTIKGTAEGLCYLGLLSERRVELLDELKEELSDELDDNIDMLKDIIKMFLEPTSPMRHSIIPMLIDYGYLSADEKDQKIVNRVIIDFVLTKFLAEYNLISYYDAAMLVKHYDEHPEQIDFIVNITVDAVYKNAIARGGGYMVSWATQCLSDMICINYGPFYPKVHKAITG